MLAEYKNKKDADKKNEYLKTSSSNGAMAKNGN
jgi:hypothetical protein